jgi:hypothetical protein
MGIVRPVRTGPHWTRFDIIFGLGGSNLICASHLLSFILSLFLGMPFSDTDFV